MSLQGQFYVIWPFVILLAILLSKYIFKKSFKKTIIGLFGVLFIISISYSVYKTSTNQSWAYYDTFARLWEFSLGGILALFISNIKITKHLSIIIGWLGLFMIVSTGILFPVSNVFPGFAALYPTLGAVFIILAGSNGGNLGVHRILGSKPFISLGSVSYGIYLFHWPILIFYHIITQRAEVPLTHGLLILIVSVALSYIFTNIIEKPIRKIPIEGNKKKLGVIVVLFVSPMLISTGIWKLELKQAESVFQHVEIQEDYPGALVLHPDFKGLISNDVQIKPEPLIARKDLPDSYPDECHQKQGLSEIIQCDYGEINNPEYTVAIVGGSHSAQWLPTFQTFAEDEKIKIINLTKSACRFTSSNEVENDCAEWNVKIIETLKEINPDLVFTIADVGSLQEVPEGYVEQWEKLEKLNINVLALRDNGWFNFDPPTCVEENGSKYYECSVNQDDFLPLTGAYELLENKPSNVYYHDLTDYFCKDGKCDVVIGNILVYRDSHHITATYAETLAPILKPVVMEILKEVNEK